MALMRPQSPRVQTELFNRLAMHTAIPKNAHLGASADGPNHHLFKGDQNAITRLMAPAKNTAMATATADIAFEPQQRRRLAVLAGLPAREGDRAARRSSVPGR